jgi:GNAT superfamily N-acetyltransferase
MTKRHRPIVRPMHPKDVVEVIDMACELAAAVGDERPKIVATDFITDGLGSDRWFECFIAEAASQLVGYTLVCKGFEAHTGKRRLWLGDFYVRPAARLTGTGRALMSAVACHALQLDCEAIYWELWRMNAAGAAFYRKLQAEEVSDLAVMCLDKARLVAIAAAD